MSTDEGRKAVREAGEALWSAVHYTHSKLAYLAKWKEGLDDCARDYIDGIHDELAEALGRYETTLKAPMTEHNKAVRGDDPASGMTIRERFAMAAMQGLLSNNESLMAIKNTALKNKRDPVSLAAMVAIGHADALLAALEGDHE